MVYLPFELVIIVLSTFTEWDYSGDPNLADDANLSNLSNLSKVCKKWRLHLRPFMYTTYIDPVTLDDSKAKSLTVDRRLRFTRTILANPDLAALITAFKLDGRIVHFSMTPWERRNRPIPPFPSDSLLKLVPNLEVIHLPIIPLRYGSENLPLFLEIIRNPLACKSTFPHLKKLVLCCSALQRMGLLYADTVVDFFEHPTLEDVEIRDSTIKPLLLPPFSQSRVIHRLCLRDCNAEATALVGMLNSCSGLQTLEFVQSEEQIFDGLHRTVHTDGVQELFDALSQHGSTLEVLNLNWRDLSPGTAFARPQLCESFKRLRRLEIPEVVLMGDLEHSRIAVKERLELYPATEHTPETVGDLLETIPSVSVDTTSHSTSSDIVDVAPLCLAEILPVSLVTLHIIHCFPGIHQALSSLNDSKRMFNLEHVSVELLGLGDNRVKSGGWFDEDDNITKSANNDKAVAKLEERRSKWYVRRTD